MPDYSYIQRNKQVLNDDQWLGRIKDCLLVCNDNILVEDRLEKGVISIYGYTGGAVDLPVRLHNMEGCMDVSCYPA